MHKPSERRAYLMGSILFKSQTKLDKRQNYIDKFRIFDYYNFHHEKNDLKNR